MKRNAVAWAALIVSTAALVSSQGLTRPVPAAPRMPVESQKTARSLSDAFVAVADFVRPSVVQISAQRRVVSNNPRVPGGRRGNPFQTPPGNIDPRDLNNNPLLRDMLKRFFDEQGVKPEQQQYGLAEGTGSGFIYDDKGHILTNNHVVNGAGKITVTFHDGVEAAATVVGTDPKSDVAVIKVDMTGYPALPKGLSEKLRVGELVMAVGSPFGLSQSVTMGIVSATERNNLGINSTGTNDSFESFIQTDAPINPGNSGGPLVDMNGRVVGINSAIMSGGRGFGGSGGNDGVGFAIPIDMAQNVADKLIKDGKVSRARIGIRLGPLNPVMASSFGIDPKTKGALVEGVLANSPAEKAGLKPGDVIVGFNNQPVVSVPTFRLTVAASEIGKPYSLKYFRDGKEHATEVVLGDAEKYRFEEEKLAEAPADARPDAKPEAGKTEISSFGLEVQPLTPELAKGMGLKDAEGLLISSVKEGSPAEAAGLESGMVITQVVRDKKPQPVGSVKDFQSLSEKLKDLVVYVKSGQDTGRFVNLSKTDKN